MSYQMKPIPAPVAAKLRVNRDQVVRSRVAAKITGLIQPAALSMLIVLVGAELKTANRIIHLSLRTVTLIMVVRNGRVMSNSYSIRVKSFMMPIASSLKNPRVAWKFLK